MLSREELMKRCMQLDEEKSLNYINSIKDEDERKRQINRLIKIAVVVKKVNLVRKLIEAGACIDVSYENGMNIFNLICYLGDKEIVGLVLDSITDINKVDERQNTALHWACANRFIDVVKLLIARGINVNLKNKIGWTAIRMAIVNRDKDMMSLLIKSGADVNIKYGGGRTLLHIAAYSNYCDIVKLLIESGADINVGDEHGITAIHAFCYKDNIEMVKFCLDNNADIDSRDNRYFTPLSLACLRCNQKMADFLIKRGANINIKTCDGVTLLYRMILEKHYDMANFLIERGADVNLKSDSGISPIHIACIVNNIAIINALLKRGANVRTKAVDGCTPLHVASACCNEKIVKVLLKWGADVKDKTNDNVTVLHLVCEKNNKLLINLFLEQDVDIDVRTNMDGSTALHMLCKKGNEDGVAKLINKGANVDIKNFEGKTPLDVVCDNNLSDIAYIIADKARIISDNVIDWAIEEEDIKLLDIILLKNDMPNRVVKKLVLRNKKETLRHVLGELKIRGEELNIRKREPYPGIDGKKKRSLLGIAILNNNIEIANMLMEYNLEGTRSRVRKLSDVLHNEDANELLKDPANSARKVIKKIKTCTEEKLMDELKDEDEEAYNKYKFCYSDKIQKAKQGKHMLPLI